MFYKQEKNISYKSYISYLQERDSKHRTEDPNKESETVE